jgi:hypothetical protein
LKQVTIDDDRTYVALLEDWPELIGRFVCAFSACEYWTYLILEALGGPALRQAFAKRELDARIEEIKSRLKGKEDVHGQATKVLGAMRGLAHNRNLACHNSPMGHIWIDPATEEPHLTMELRGANNLECKRGLKAPLTIRV